MLSSPLAILAVLAGLVALIFQLEKRPELGWLFKRLPAVFWIYALPMLLTSAGVLPEASPLYTALTRHLLPASLALLLLSSDLRSIAALGPRALLAMAAASVGISAGVVLSFVVFGSRLGGEAGKTFAAICGTWIGGSANLLAVGTALGLSPESQGIAILVDTVVGYSWMGILIALAARQPRLDRFFRADRAEVEAIGERVRARLNLVPYGRPPCPTPRCWSVRTGVDRCDMALEAASAGGQRAYGRRGDLILTTGSSRCL